MNDNSLYNKLISTIHQWFISAVGGQAVICKRRLVVLWVLFYSLSLLTACTASPFIEAETAHQTIQSAWQKAWHGTWELTWTQSPLPGPIVFEAWCTTNREKHRFEILEATTPSLIGLTYVNTGYNATIYNRLSNQPSDSTYFINNANLSLPFSPISDALLLIDQTLSQTPQTVQQLQASTVQIPINHYQFNYQDDHTLTIWLNTETNLIIRLHLQNPHTNLTLASRSLETLTNPHPKLFK